SLRSRSCGASPTVKKSRSRCSVTGFASWCERARSGGYPMKLLKTLVVMMLAAGCALQSSGQADRGQPQPQPQPTAGAPTPSNKKVDAAVVERLGRAMIALMAKMNKPLQANQVQVGVMDDPHVNAASAGGGEFYVTTGLLEKANDDQMRGVLAHELAHDDLGHVAK